MVNVMNHSAIELLNMFFQLSVFHDIVIPSSKQCFFHPSCPSSARPGLSCQTQLSWYTGQDSGSLPPQLGLGYIDSWRLTQGKVHVSFKMNKEMYFDVDICKFSCLPWFFSLSHLIHKLGKKWICISKKWITVWKLIRILFLTSSTTFIISVW